MYSNIKNKIVSKKNLQKKILNYTSYLFNETKFQNYFFFQVQQINNKRKLFYNLKGNKIEEKKIKK